MDYLSEDCIPKDYDLATQHQYAISTLLAKHYLNIPGSSSQVKAVQCLRKIFCMENVSDKTFSRFMCIKV